MPRGAAMLAPLAPLAPLALALALAACGSSRDTAAPEGPIGEQPRVAPPVASPPMPQVYVAAANGVTRAPAGHALPVEPFVWVTTDGHTPIASVDVTARVTGGGGTLERTAVTTDRFGARLGRWVLGPDPGPNTIEVSIPTGAVGSLTVEGMPLGAPTSIDGAYALTAIDAAPLPATVPPNLDGWSGPFVIDRAALEIRGGTYVVTHRVRYEGDFVRTGRILLDGNRVRFCDWDAACSNPFANATVGSDGALTLSSREWTASGIERYEPVR